MTLYGERARVESTVVCSGLRVRRVASPTTRNMKSKMEDRRRALRQRAFEGGGASSARAFSGMHHRENGSRLSPCCQGAWWYTVVVPRDRMTEIKVEGSPLESRKLLSVCGPGRGGRRYYCARDRPGREERALDRRRMLMTACNSERPKSDASLQNGRHAGGDREGQVA